MQVEKPNLYASFKNQYLSEQTNHKLPSGFANFVDGFSPLGLLGGNPSRLKVVYKEKHIHIDIMLL